MTSLLINKLDYQRLCGRIDQAKTGPNVSRSQIINLLQRFEGAKLLDPTKMPANVVTMNSTVNLVYVGSNKTVDIRLVYPEEADGTQNQISIFAPLATAILGRKQGDLASMITPYGTVRVRINQILYQPEAAGDLSL